MRLISWSAAALAGLVAAGCATSGGRTPLDPATLPPSLYTPVVPPGTVRLAPEEAERRLQAATSQSNKARYVDFVRIEVLDEAIRFHLRAKEGYENGVRASLGAKKGEPLTFEYSFHGPPPRLEQCQRPTKCVRFPPFYEDWAAERFPLTYPNDRESAAREVVDVIANLRSTPVEDPALVARFDAAVPEYRARRPKPELPQEARRFKVQAELAVEERRFSEAADLFQKALAIVPWWPEGHYNRALVLGEQARYALAIRSMKRYLALVPEAPDAQAAQDRIYAWEAMAERRSAR